MRYPDAISKVWRSAQQAQPHARLQTMGPGRRNRINFSASPLAREKTLVPQAPRKANPSSPQVCWHRVGFAVAQPTSPRAPFKRANGVCGLGRISSRLRLALWCTHRLAGQCDGEGLPPFDSAVSTIKSSVRCRRRGRCPRVHHVTPLTPGALPWCLCALDSSHLTSGQVTSRRRRAVWDVRLTTLRCAAAAAT